MNAVATISNIDPIIIESLVINGDLSRLSPAQKVALYNYRCAQAGLDPAAKPFDLLSLSGKQVLYANASCTQQLCKIHKLSVEVLDRTKIDDIFVVNARVRGPDARSTDNTGAVSIGGLKGEALSNALMKATTKAIRRTVLAHVGLGMLDETEVETIPNTVRLELAVDPRGDTTVVDNTIRDKHVKAIEAILGTDAEETVIAQNLRDYVDENLYAFQELFIAVADELSKQNICSKAGFKSWMKIGLPPKS